MLITLRGPLARKVACSVGSAVNTRIAHLRNCQVKTLPIRMTATNNAGGGASKFDKEELKRRLDPMAYHVTQERGTERPGTGTYCKTTEPGMYRCIVCDEPLFKSDHKFHSGCGWPSFWDAADKTKIKLTEDVSHGMERTEVTCANCGAHLGHLFDDGPQPSGQRYCINSAALKFDGKDKK